MTQIPRVRASTGLVTFPQLSKFHRFNRVCILACISTIGVHHLCSHNIPACIAPCRALIPSLLKMPVLCISTVSKGSGMMKVSPAICTSSLSISTQQQHPVHYTGTNGGKDGNSTTKWPSEQGEQNGGDTYAVTNGHAGEGLLHTSVQAPEKPGVLPTLQQCQCMRVKIQSLACLMLN